MTAREEEGTEPPPARKRVPSWLPHALGYLLSAACVVWVLRRFSFHGLTADIKSLDWKWVAIAVVVELAVYVCQAWRWNTLLAPVARLRFWRTVQAIYIGLFANDVLPLKVGELIRPYLLAHWNDLRISLGFASAAVERLIDGLWILVAFLITAGFLKGMPQDLTILVQILGGVLLAGGIALVWVLSRHQETVHVPLTENRWAATLRHVIEGLHLMGNWRTLLLTTMISLLFSILQIVPIYALFKADNMDLGFWAAAGVSTILRLGTFIPNAPGNLGVANVAVIAALRLFDVETHDAATYSLIMLAVLTLPLIVAGAVATALTGVNIGELRDRAKHSLEAHSHPRP